MTGRIRLDEMTSDALDRLYAELDRYEEVVGELNEANTMLARDLANAARERDERQWRAEEGQRTTRVQRERAARAEAALREVLNCFTPAATLRSDGTVLTYSTTVVVDAARMTHWRAALGEQPASAPAAAEATSHIYLSTGCLHGHHDYCQNHTGHSGTKTPAQCKFCSAPCTCGCHQHDPPRPADQPKEQ